MEYKIRILACILCHFFRYAHFIFVMLFKDLQRKVSIFDFSKKQFNARLTIFNVSLIFVLLCNTIKIKCR